MSVKAMSWVWSHSRSRPTQRLVLLAIADCGNDQGREAYPSTATLAGKTGLSERAVRRTVTELAELGELSVQYKAGPRGTNRYRVIMRDYPDALSGSDDTDTRTEKPGTRTVSPPARVAGYPDGRSGYPARESADPATLAPEPSLTVREQATATPLPPAGPTVTQRSKRITDAYAESEPMCRWPAVNAIVIRAIKAERWGDDEVRDALLRLAKENRPVTVDTLRIELNGLPPPTRRSSADKPAAAKAIPAAEQCRKHRGYPGGTRADGQPRCGQCRAGTAGGGKR